jgi:excisionase family DNA binding protein
MTRRTTHVASTKPLYVRLPAEQAQRLDEAASALAASKKDLVAGLVERYVHPEDPDQLEALREVARSAPRPRRIEIDFDGPALTVGHHAFHPTPPEVLDAAQAAELLAVDEQAIVEAAERGDLPGRRIGGQWRFARRALLDWLGAAA